MTGQIDRNCGKPLMKISSSSHSGIDDGRWMAIYNMFLEEEDFSVINS